ncbi:serine hydrolase [Pacificimonas sp. WHA3]|uniref:Serine hydrolase n=1 Tax=Pacificimonas pallii TaxID=2827236 RepID=A0ABS6SFF3_9SPHN|nr:serine hydrolase [Pacificimonas pallii]MBV7257138.1 serine hydrolase [Pacificimonas pallii]
MCKRIHLVIALAAITVAAPGLAEPPSGFGSRVERLRLDAGVPGMAIAIVENGRTSLVKGWGVRKQGDASPVDADTIFPTGSTAKAFTATALATLVDEGRLDWDDRVIDHMPWFAMYDAWVTREITVRDLLVHRSGLGLGAGDLLFVPRSRLTRRQTVERLRYLEPATSFRSAYAYDNVLYIVAGQLIEEVTGKTWENYIADAVLKPAGMRTATPLSEVRFATRNRAFPHARNHGKLRGDGPVSVLDERDELGHSFRPAGGLTMSANDLAKWLTIQLQRGALPGGGRLFSERTAEDMWTPVVPIPISKPPGELSPLTPDYSAYALGWGVKDYKGTKLIWHSGMIFGFIAVVVLVPEHDFGFAIVMNSEDEALRGGLKYELLDHYLGHPFMDWPARFASLARAELDGQLGKVASDIPDRARVGPTLPRAHYASTYRDKWYGDVIVTERDQGLWIEFANTPDMEGRLVHHQYDTFRTEFTDPAIEEALVTFSINASGQISGATMIAASPVADFSYDYHDLDLVPVP